MSQPFKFFLALYEQCSRGRQNYTVLVITHYSAHRTVIACIFFWLCIKYTATSMLLFCTPVYLHGMKPHYLILASLTSSKLRIVT